MLSRLYCGRYAVKPFRRLSRPIFTSSVHYEAAPAAKITTHYTRVPRETDPRWEGIEMERYCQYFSIYSFGSDTIMTFKT